MVGVERGAGSTGLATTASYRGFKEEDGHEHGQKDGKAEAEPLSRWHVADPVQHPLEEQPWGVREEWPKTATVGERRVIDHRTPALSNDPA